MKTVCAGCTGEFERKRQRFYRVIDVPRAEAVVAGTKQPYERVFCSARCLAYWSVEENRREQARQTRRLKEGSP